MIDDHKLKAGDYIVYVDNKITGRYYHELVIMPLPLTLNKAYKILKTNYVSSTSIGVTI
jgi:hypothetical protein